MDNSDDFDPFSDSGCEAWLDHGPNETCADCEVPEPLCTRGDRLHARTEPMCDVCEREVTQRSFADWQRELKSAGIAMCFGFAGPCKRHARAKRPSTLADCPECQARFADDLVTSARGRAWDEQR